MPLATGTEVAFFTRSLESLLRVPEKHFIVASSSLRKEQISEELFKKQVIDEFRAKPLSSQDLEQII